MAEITLVRHGETEWSADGRHTSRTDLALTPRGEQKARALAGTLARERFAAVLASPRVRALRTAELAGLAVTEVLPELAEWDYGSYEGLTTARIRAQRPEWDLWTDGAPDGERPDQVAERMDRALARIAALLRTGPVAVFSHGHALRALGARWLGLAVDAGALLHLDTATLSVLGYEHDRPVILRWNCPAAAADAAAPDR